MTKPDLSQKIIQTIKKDHVAIKPKLYFVLGSILFSVGLSAVFLLSILFLNILFFRVQIIGHLLPFYPSPFQTHLILNNLPWFQFWFFVLFLVTGILMLKKSGLAYKFNPLLIFLTTVILVVLFGYLLSITSLNRLGPRLAPPLYRHQPFSRPPTPFR